MWLYNKQEYLRVQEYHLEEGLLLVPWWEKWAAEDILVSSFSSSLYQYLLHLAIKQTCFILCLLYKYLCRLFRKSSVSTRAFASVSRDQEQIQISFDYHKILAFWFLFHAHVQLGAIIFLIQQNIAKTIKVFPLKTKIRGDILCVWLCLVSDFVRDSKTDITCGQEHGKSSV